MDLEKEDGPWEHRRGYVYSLDVEGKALYNLSSI